jgi:NADH-quinone oxidoreductase subunit M
LGGYAYLRFLLPIFPFACKFYAYLVYTLSIMGIIFASLSAIRQIDLKKIIAYTSIAHMNLVVIGIFSFNIFGLLGSILLMLAHGLVSAALFFMVGVLYDCCHTRLVRYYGGLTQIMPIFVNFFFFFNISNMGMPGT